MTPLPVGGGAHSCVSSMECWFPGKVHPNTFVSLICQAQFLKLPFLTSSDGARLFHIVSLPLPCFIALWAWCACGFYICFDSIMEYLECCAWDIIDIYKSRAQGVLRLTFLPHLPPFLCSAESRAIDKSGNAAWRFSFLFVYEYWLRNPWMMSRSRRELPAPCSQFSHLWVSPPPLILVPATFDSLGTGYEAWKSDLCVSRPILMLCLPSLSSSRQLLFWMSDIHPHHEKLR